MLPLMTRVQVRKFLRGGHPYTPWASLPRQVWQRITPVPHTVLCAWASQLRTTSRLLLLLLLLYSPRGATTAHGTRAH